MQLRCTFISSFREKVSKQRPVFATTNDNASKCYFVYNTTGRESIEAKQNLIINQVKSHLKHDTSENLGH